MSIYFTATHDRERMVFELASPEAEPQMRIWEGIGGSISQGEEGGARMYRSQYRGVVGRSPLWATRPRSHWEAPGATERPASESHHPKNEEAGVLMLPSLPSVG